MARRQGGCCVVLVLAALLHTAIVRAQPAVTAPASPPAPPAPAPVKDALGRDTPRGTVLGFMHAARNARDDLAPLYLNLPAGDQRAADLARKLFAVLDSRLPPRLTELSDRPEGSMLNPLRPDLNVIGVVTTDDGPLDIVLERVTRGGQPPAWLFARKTLDAIPSVYEEVKLVAVDRYLPAFLSRPRIGGIRLFAWFGLFVLVPIGYRVTGWFGLLLRPIVSVWRRRHPSAVAPHADLVPGSVRLIVLAVAIRWLLGVLELPLLERQFWSIVSGIFVIVAVAWALLLFNDTAERTIYRRFQSSGHGEIASILRLVRRLADVLVIAAGVLVTLHYFGVDPTAALAGLGIGGIAVALAAQKTLENVIGGLSIIFDKAVRVGDFLKLGDTLGTVDYIGLRSTRIRTLDRTIVSVPNGQIANVNLETLSARDKFWFHHVVALRHATSPAQMRALIAAIRDHLGNHPLIDRRESIRVRFIRIAPSSLDVELFAYLLAADYEAFLEAQQLLLLEIIEMVEHAGAALALPSQTLHLADAGAAAGAAPRLRGRRSPQLDGPRRTAESA